MADALRVVRAANPSPMTLDGTRSFLLGRRHPVVIDPGPAIPEHVDAILAALEGARPVAVLLTHAHPDHAAAAPELARRTGAPLCLGRGALDPAVPASVVDRWLADGDTLTTDAGEVTAVHTPGHAPEHHAFHWTGEAAPGGGALFVGDLFMGEGDTTLVSPPEGDLAAYLGSLERVAALAPGILHPAHGEPLADPAGAVARYREHRRERVEQVRRALRENPGAAAPELVGRIYGAELHPGLRRAAEGSIEAMLRYIRESRMD